MERSTSLAAAAEAMLLACKLHDPYTALHCRRVSRLAAAIGESLGLDARRVEIVRLGGLLHDIGKLQVPMEILTKAGGLTATERRRVQSHPAAGGRVVRPLAHRTIEDIVAQHHERLDGSGYPHALRGSQIRLETCIVAVADVFESIAFDRPYRAGLGEAAALAELKAGRGRLYAPQIVAACERLACLGQLGLHGAAAA